MWGPDAPVVPPPRALRNFILAFSGFGAFLGFLYVAHPEMPAVRREYPFSGLVKELGGLEQNKVRLCKVNRPFTHNSRHALGQRGGLRRGLIDSQSR